MREIRERLERRKERAGNKGYPFVLV